MTKKTNTILKNSYELPNNVIEAVPNPIVTVRTITYNHAPYIRECIESVLMQKTDFPFEYIIGEDFSSDGTREIVFEYAKKYPDKIRVITADQNFGMMPNVRRCALAVRGKYIALCEGDDYWTDPYKLQKQVDTMEAEPDIVITYHDVIKIDNNKSVIDLNFRPENRKKDLTAEELKTGAWIQTNTMCFRNIIKKYPEGYFNVYNADIFLVSLLGNYGRGKYLDSVQHSCYRKHDGGIYSSKSQIIRKIKSLHTPAKLMLYYKNNGDKEFYDFFKDKTQKAILSMLDLEMDVKTKLQLLKCILLYSRNIGFKNTLYYIKKTL